MFVKRYIANDLSEAMEKIRKELGSDAVILSHRNIRKSVFSKKLVEVMVAYEPASDKKVKIESSPVQTVEANYIPPSSAEIGAPIRVSEQPGYNNGNSHYPPARREGQTGMERAPLSSADSLRGVMDYHNAAVKARYGQPVDDGLKPIVYRAENTGAIKRDEMHQDAYDGQRFSNAPFRPGMDLPKNNMRSETPEAEMEYDWSSTLRRAYTASPASDAASFKNDNEEDSRNKKSSALKESEAKIDELNAKLLELRGVVKTLTDKIVTSDRNNLLRFAPAVMRVYNTLIRQDIQEDIAIGICEQAQISYDKTKIPPENLAREIIVKMLGMPSPVIAKRDKKSIVMLIGPTGVGKTTTLVKLAGSYILSESLRVGFINCDTYRVAAQEQLKVYADIMEIPCCTIYTPEEIPLALHTLSDCDLILIDTAGKSLGDKVFHEELRALIAASGADNVELLLHVSAAMSKHACRELIRNFSYLKNYRLVITKLDEVTAWGSVLNISTFAKKPIAFVTMGQNVPQDIEVPNMLQIADKLLESEGL